MSSKFKIGDVVRCTEYDRYTKWSAKQRETKEFFPGDITTVRSYYSDNNKVFSTEEVCDGDTFLFWTKNFELAVPEVAVGDTVISNYSNKEYKVIGVKFDEKWMVDVGRHGPGDWWPLADFKIKKLPAVAAQIEDIIGKIKYLEGQRSLSSSQIGKLSTLEDILKYHHGITYTKSDVTAIIKTKLTFSNGVEYDI